MEKVCACWLASSVVGASTAACVSQMPDRRPRIIFFALRELHVPVLLPVYRAVQRAGE